jgi:hypothetical protein
MVQILRKNSMVLIIIGAVVTVVLAVIVASENNPVTKYAILAGVALGLLLAGRVVRVDTVVGVGLVAAVPLTRWQIRVSTFFVEPTMVLTVLGILVLLFLAFKGKRIVLARVELPVLFLAAVALVSTLGSQDWVAGLERTGKILLMYAFLLVLINLVGTRNQAKLVMVAVSIGLAVVFVVGLIELFRLVNQRVAVVGSSFFVQSTFSHVNEMGTYPVALVPLLVSLHSASSSRKFKAFLKLGILSGCGIVVISQSRSALGILILSLLLLPSARVRVTVLLAATAVLVGAEVFSFAKIILAKSLIWTLGEGWVQPDVSLAGTLARGDQLRLELIEQSLKYVWTSVRTLLVGVGPSSFHLYMDSYTSHNWYVTTLAETGVLGLLAALMWIVGGFRAIQRTYRKSVQSVLEGSSSKLVYWGCCIGLAAHLAINLFHDYGFAHARTWLYLALCLIVCRYFVGGTSEAQDVQGGLF